jgi:hypothetical protein
MTREPIFRIVHTTVDRDPARVAFDYVRGHLTELLLLATHQRRGIDRWLHKPAAEPVARESGTITLFLPRGGTGFVSYDTGGVTLRRVLRLAPCPVLIVPAGSKAAMPRLFSGRPVRMPCER